MKRDVAMTTNISGHTAKIYQFPVRGRANNIENRERPKLATDQASQRFADAADSGSWYHQAAVEAERANAERH